MQNKFIKISTLSFSVVILILLSYSYFYLLGLIKENELSTIDNRLKIENQIYKEKESKNISSLLDKTKETRERLEKVLVKDDDMLSIIETLENLGKNTGAKVEITNLKSEDSSSLKPGDINNMKANIKISGTWLSILKTIYLLENFPFYSSISNLRLSRNGIENDNSGDSLKAPTSGDKKTKSYPWSANLSIEILKMK